MSPTLAAGEQAHQPTSRHRRDQRDTANGRDHPDRHRSRDQKPRSQNPTG
jgi:hypothetical protein